MIKLERLTFQYNGAAKPALEDIYLRIKPGDFVLVTGPSGSGKSTFCRTLNGLVPHFHGGTLSGTIEVAGLDPLSAGAGVMASRVGMVFQDPENQMVTSDVEHEICFGMENLSLTKDLMAKRMEETLDTMGISHLRHRPLNELSGGEKQKVAIASILALHPQVLVLDEPTSELDPKGADDVFSILSRLNDELGLTIIVVEHRLERIIQYADRFILLNEGRVIIDKPVREAMDRHTGEILHNGIGLPPLINLHRLLKDKGIEPGRPPFTVKEGRQVFETLLKKALKPVYPVIHSNHSAPAVEMENVSFAYPSGMAALKGINLSIGRGELVVIMGRNASGKTTLVKQLNRLLVPAKGKVKILGKEITGASTAEMSASVGLVFQNPQEHLFADSVREEIAFGLKNKGLDGNEIKQISQQMLDKFGLSHLAHRYPRELSGGEKQRLALAAVMAGEPEILVLDEPTRGIEDRLKIKLMHLIDDYRHRSKTVILITHDVELVARFASRVILMSEGRIIVDGDKHHVMSQALMFSPQINRLIQPYEKYGVPADILTAEEVVSAL
ncbi:MAG: energy-coupling factor ABC transporter ATP-binding protein [Dehalococcoidaceae bacterium]|nr:energy-coupling factor ABC transporter ATP-binding protein [Dehalococcoidaceae bacterium]